MTRLCLLSIALFVFGTVTTSCTRMNRMPTLASGSGNSGSDSGSDSGNSNSGNSGTGTNKDDKMSTLTVTGLLVVGVVALVYLATMTGGPDTGTPGIQSAQVEEARTYLQANRRQIRIDISRGQGPFVEQVAQLHRVPPALRGQVGAALQAAHGDLDQPLADAMVSRAETLAFARAMDQALRADPSLSPHLHVDPDAIPGAARL